MRLRRHVHNLATPGVYAPVLHTDDATKDVFYIDVQRAFNQTLIVISGDWSARPGDGMAISYKLAQDRRSWDAAVRDEVKAKKEISTTRQG